MKSLTTLFRRPFSSRSATLASVAVIATAILISVAAVSGDDEDRGRGATGIEGTWLAVVTQVGGPPPFESLITFGAGGALVVTEAFSSPASGNIYQGTWARTGPREITFSFLGFKFDPTGVHAGYIRVHETIEVNRSGTAYDSVESTVQIVDLDGNELVFNEDVSTHAVRIEAE
jgi:hypothetical protein